MHNELSSKNLHVLLQMRSNALTQKGGDTVVMQKLHSELLKMGVSSTIDLECEQKLEDYDLVHLFNFCTPEVIQGLASRCVTAKKPFVVTTMYEDWTHYFSKMAGAFQALGTYVYKGQPKDEWQELEQIIYSGQEIAKQDNSWTAQYADALIASGTFEALTLRRDYPWTKSVKLYYCGSDFNAEADNGERFIRETGIKDFILCVGRLESRKNQLMLLKALEDSSLPLVFATGGFAYQAKYEEICRMFKRKGATYFLDRIDPNLLASAYAAAKVHVLPSWCELPGLVSLEAARYGTNVVITDNGTIRDYLGSEAFYCSPESPESILKAIHNAYDTPRNPVLKERASHFTWQSMAKSTFTLYEEVLGSRPDCGWMPAPYVFSDKTLSLQNEITNKKFKILFITSCLNHSKVMMPIAKILCEKGHDINFMSLDSFYDERGAPIINNSGFNCLDFGGYYCKGRYFSELNERSLFEIESAQDIEIALRKEMPDCIVLAHDQEALESQIVHTARALGISLVKIQHGMSHAKQLDLSQNVHKFTAGESGFDLDCVWSGQLAYELAERGVVNRLFVSGNPRFDKLTKLKNRKPSTRPYKILLAAQNFAKHCFMTAKREFDTYTEIIDDLLSRDDVEVIFRPHPQQTQIEKYEQFCKTHSPRLSFSSEGDSLDVFSKVDALVTISSTIAVESCILRVSSILLSYYSWEDTSCIPKKRKQFQEFYEKVDLSKPFAFGIPSLEDYANNWSRFVDGKASERIARAIIALQTRKTAMQMGVSTEYHASVVIIMDEQSSWEGLDSVLGSDEFGYEVIVVDRSLDSVVSKSISAKVKDARLRIVTSKEGSLSDAFNKGLATCCTDYIFVLQPNCAAQSGWVERNYENFIKMPKLELLLSYCMNRDRNGICRGLWTPNFPLDAELFKDSTISCPLTLGFAFRRKDIDVSSFSNSEDKDFYYRLVASIYNKCFQHVGTIGINSPAVCAPLHPDNIGRAISTDYLQVTKTEQDKKFSILVEEPKDLTKYARLIQSLKQQDSSFDSFEIICAVSDTHKAQQIEQISSGLNFRTIQIDPSHNFGIQSNSLVSTANNGLCFIINEEQSLNPSFLSSYRQAYKQDSDYPLCMFGPLSLVDEHSSYLNSVFNAALEHSRYFSPHVSAEQQALHGFNVGYTSNLVFPLKAFKELNHSFNSDLSTNWAQNLVLAYRLWKDGFRFKYAPHAELLSHQSFTIQHLESTETQRAKDMLLIIQNFPELCYHLFYILLPHPVLINNYKQRIASEASSIKTAENQIASLANTPYTKDAEGEQLKISLSQTFNALVEHYRIRELIRAMG